LLFKYTVLNKEFKAVHALEDANFYLQLNNTQSVQIIRFHSFT
jgi:hypothetical protein